MIFCTVHTYQSVRFVVVVVVIVVVVVVDATVIVVAVGVVVVVPAAAAVSAFNEDGIKLIIAFNFLNKLLRQYPLKIQRDTSPFVT
jgi:hypothetical protein